MEKYAKFVVAVLAALGVVASSGLLEGQAQLTVNTLVSAVGAALVYLVPNEKLPKREDGHADLICLGTFVGVMILVILALLKLAK